MNKHINFLSALIGSDAKASEQEIAQGLAALQAAGVAIQQVPTQADGSFKCGRNKECFRGKQSLCSSGYILTPSSIFEVYDADTKDAGWASAFAIGRMDDKSGVVRVERGRYHVEIVEAFLALAGVVIAENEIYKEDLIPKIIERINAHKEEVIIEEADNTSTDMSAEELKAARKAAKQAEKAAKIAEKKGRI